MLPPLELKVYPNPWGLHPNVLDDGSVTPTSDHEGRPCGGRFFDLYAGTALNKRTVVLDTEPRGRGDERSRRQRTIYDYCGVAADDPELASKLARADAVSVPVRQDLVAAIKRGELIAGNEETAKFARVAYEDPKALFPKMELAFDAARDRVYGEGASVDFKARMAHFRGDGDKPKAKPVAAPAAAPKKSTSEASV